MFDKLVNSGYFILDFHLRYWIWTWLCFISCHFTYRDAACKTNYIIIMLWYSKFSTGQATNCDRHHCMSKKHKQCCSATHKRKVDIAKSHFTPVCEVTCIKSICFIICSILKTFYSIFVFVLIDVMCTGLSSKHWTF